MNFANRVREHICALDIVFNRTLRKQIITIYEGCNATFGTARIHELLYHNNRQAVFEFKYETRPNPGAEDTVIDVYCDVAITHRWGAKEVLSVDLTQADPFTPILTRLLQG